MGKINILLLGFGTVGEGIYQTIQTHQSRLQSLLGHQVEIVGVLVNNLHKERKLDHHIIISDNLDDLLALPNVDVVMEAIVGVEPGYTYLSKALEKGIHVISANKELLAHKGAELHEVAARNNAKLEFEAAVAGGVPIIGTLKRLLRVNNVTKIEAILNGTSNYILTELVQTKASFADALRDAQLKGYAEADPSNDIDGWDAFYKLMVISDLLFGKQPNWDNVVRRGIRGIEQTDVIAADSIGLRFKHIATLEFEGESVRASVEPVLVGPSHSLYAVDGVANGIRVTGDIVGEVQLQGPGAGALPTASAMIEDLIGIYEQGGQRVVQADVEFGIEDNSLSSWLVTGQLLAINEVEVEDKWTVVVDGHQVECSVITGTSNYVDKLIKANGHSVKAYRMEKPLVKIKELSIG